MARESLTALPRPRPDQGPVRSRPSVVLPAFALVFGIVGTAAGAGAASAHLAKAGLDAAGR